MPRINWNEPKFGEEEISAVAEVLRRGQVTEGPKSKELEDRLKEFLGIKHVILTTSGTAALFLAIKADSIIKKIRDFEVIVPDLTMIAVATSIKLAGGKPVFIDVEKERSTIDTEKIEEKINDKTIAIVPVHVFGRAAEMKKIIQIAVKHNLSVIEDAAEALGSKYNGKFLGTIGKVGCFSLQANKITSCAHGGFIVTDDDKYNEILRRLKDFGRFDKNEILHSIEGWNYKFNDILAAVALEQFKRINIRMKKLLEQRKLYMDSLIGVNEVSFPPVDLNSGEIPLYIDVLVKKREGLIKYLADLEIYPRECWPALHMNPPYQDQGSDVDFPVSSFLSRNTLWLPNGFNVSDMDIRKVCEKIKEFYNE